MTEVNKETVKDTTWNRDSNTSNADAELDELMDNRSEVFDADQFNFESTAFVSPSCLEEEKLRRKIKFFFMNPIQKWQAKQRFPYKFMIQVVKIIVVTVQLCLFAQHRYTHVNYVWDNRISFSHLFLLGWDATREVNAYPPATGPLAIYKQPEFFNTIDYAVLNYYNLSDAIGPYTYTKEDNSITPLVLCLFHYKEGTIFGFNESYIFNSEIDEICVQIDISNRDIDNFSSYDFLKEKNITVEFSALVKARLSLGIKTVNLKSAGPITPPDCYKFNISIFFDNQDHDGQMLLSLDAEPYRLLCKGDTEYISDNKLDSILRSILNSLVIVVCLLSFILCCRAIYRAQLLKFETMAFFKKNYHRELSVEGRLEFLNFWYIMIIVNDVLIILGSSVKEQIERNQIMGDAWNVCSILLGVGNLLMWFGVLRYLGFFQTYNVVILTLKRAAPDVARFLLCALLIYCGFTFCGWLILSPYHIKFQTLSLTSECLFSLINGDDMFATFSILSTPNSSMLWWFSRVYLYSFICLFIYVIISLFISIIMDAYETIKQHYTTGFPKSDLQVFMSQCCEEASSTLFRSDSSSSLGDVMDCCGRHCKRTARTVLNRMCCIRYNNLEEPSVM